MPLSSRTCELSTEEALREVLTLCREASPVRTYPLPEKEKGSMGGGAQGFGKSLPESWAKWDRAASSWKMSQQSLLTGTSESFLGTWPAWGLMLNGFAFQPEHLEPILSEIDFSPVD